MVVPELAQSSGCSRAAQGHAGPGAVERDAAVPEGPHRAAALLQHARGGGDVGGGREVADVAAATDQRAEDQRTVADRLVAGHAHLAVDRRAPCDAPLAHAASSMPRRNADAAAAGVVLGRRTWRRAAPSPPPPPRTCRAARPGVHAGSGQNRWPAAAVCRRARGRAVRMPRRRSRSRAPVVPTTPTQYTKPRGAAGGELDPRRRRRRRHQRDQRDPVGLARAAQRRRLVGGQVRRDDAVDPGGRRVGAESLHPVRQHRVDVRHEGQRDGDARGARLGHLLDRQRAWSCRCAAPASRRAGRWGRRRAGR